MGNSKPSRYDSLKLAGKAIKSFFTGDGVLSDFTLDPSTYGQGFTTQTFWQFLSGTHSFNRKALQYLVETGYSNNPVGFGIIQKIMLAQSNILFTPYWKGKPYKSKTFDLDISMALQMLLTTGNVFIWKKEVIGFQNKNEVLNTLLLEEFTNNRSTKFKYYLGNGTYVTIPYEELIHIKITDISKRDTVMGLSPLQAALMPIESLKEMYTADTSLLKNKGRDVLITNDSDTPLLEDEKDDNDKEINRRIAGATKTGGVATSNARLRVLNLGRTVKELALWDGYKIKKRDLCDVLQVDSGLFNDPDNKTYSNRAEAEKSLYTSCVIPFCRMITENKDLVNAIGYEIFLDVSHIECLQISQNLRFEKNKTITDAVVSLNKSVNEGTITKQIAVALLINEWGYDEMEASIMIVDKETNLNPTTDKVNTLSPIVATKVLESMTTNERRDLVGLEDMADGDSIPQPTPSF